MKKLRIFIPIVLLLLVLCFASCGNNEKYVDLFDGKLEYPERIQVFIIGSEDMFTDPGVRNDADAIKGFIDMVNKCEFEETALKRDVNAAIYYVYLNQTLYGIQEDGEGNYYFFRSEEVPESGTGEKVYNEKAYRANGFDWNIFMDFINSEYIKGSE